MRFSTNSFSLRRASFAAYLLVIVGAASNASAILLNDFQTGTAEGWQQGAAAPPLSVLADSGPLGAGDFALQVVADASGAAGRLVFFNTSAEWSGDYGAKGYDSLEGVLLNNSGQTLSLRAAVDGPGGRFVTNAFSVPSSSQYQDFSLGLLASDFTSVDGGTSISSTLANVSVLRLLHNPTPAWRGVNIDGTFLFDSGPLVPPVLRWNKATGMHILDSSLNWTPSQKPTLADDVEFGPGLGSLDVTAVLRSTVTDGGRDMSFTQGTVRLEPTGVGSRVLANAGEVKIDDPAATKLANGAQVSLEGAQWNSTGDAIVGYEGYGTLSILADGEFTSPNLSIGETGAGTGQVKVVGSRVPNATLLDVDNDLTIGHAGTGGLSVSDAGEVVVGNELLIGSANGGLPMSSLAIAGRDSSVSVRSSTTVGRASPGEINVSGGGSFTTPGPVAVNGSVSVDGLESSFVSGDNLALTGLLVATSRGEVSFEGVYVGGDNAAAQGAGMLSVTSNAEVEGVAILQIWDEGVVLVDGGTIKTEQIAGPGKLDFVSGTIHLKNTSYSIGAASGPLEREFGSTDFQPKAGANFIVDQTLTVPLATSLNQVGGSIVADTIDNRQLITANGTTLTTTTALINNANLVLIDSTVNGPVNNASGAAITVVGTVDFNDLVAGAGDFFGPGAANFNGGLSPGASSAVVTFEGDVVLGSANTLEIEIGGAIPGAEYDRLEIEGAAQLDGTLKVELIDLGSGVYEPKLGDSFGFLASNGGAGGMWHTLDLPQLAPGLEWMLNPGGVTVSLNVVAALPGDYNFDGVVDAIDYAVWRESLGLTGVGHAADGDASGVVDSGDFELWKANYRAIAAAGVGSGVVPEPLTLVLLAGLVMPLATRAGSMRWLTLFCVRSDHV